MKNIKKISPIIVSILTVIFLIVSCTQPAGTKSGSGSKVKAVKLSATARAANKPFPQSIDFPGCIKPQQEVDQAIMNKQVKQLYVDWVTKYVKPALKTTGGYYVWMDKDPTGGTGKTTSEAHGYGMLTFAMMAGVDLSDIPGGAQLEDPKTYFDGMYKMFNDHRSKINNHLMSWVIDETENQDKDSDSATDGDMDIAYALVMAHDQWGSNGTINYIQEAQKIVTFGVKPSDMCLLNNRVMLGDWSDWTSFLQEFGTRPSDWMVGHFRVFNKITGDDFWLKVIDEIYFLTDKIQREYSPQTGLIPDFVVGNDNPRPAFQGWWPGDPSGWLEGPHDGDYGYNACRFPWRVSIDYAHYGEQRAKTALDKISSWLIPAHTDVTGDPPKMQYIPGEIVCGYYLDGTKIVWTDNNPTQWHGMSFTAPFTLACMVNPANQEAVDKGWWEMVTTPEGYYEDSINLLCSLVITGNWWKPAESGNIPPAPTPKPRKIGANIESYQDYVPADYMPPMGLSPDNVPMFVTFGWDDNEYPEGLQFARDMLANKTNPAGIGNSATYDGTPVGNSFYQCTWYTDAWFQVANQHWKPIHDSGIHETGNHSYSHSDTDMTADTTLTDWLYQINKAESDLAPILGSIKMYGWRTPHLAYGPELFNALKQEKYWYDCSIEEGYKWGQDGTNFYWPYTLDEGSPGHNVLYEWETKPFKLGSYPGLWELPIHCFIVPPADKCPDYGINYDLRQKIHDKVSWFSVEEGKLTGFDFNLWFLLNLTGPEAEATMKYTLDLRLMGNRAPMMIGSHTGEYSQKWQDVALKEKPDMITKPIDRKTAIMNFFNYALSKQDVRMVPNDKILKWLRHPIGLNGIDPGQTTPTPTPTIIPQTPTPTQQPLVNIALGRPGGASSQYSNDFNYTNAYDNNLKTLWASNMTEKTSYLYVDLGYLRDIQGINVQWFDKYYAKEYKLYLSSDGKNWNEIITLTNNAPGDDKLIANGTVKTRFVGLLFTQKNDAAYAIKEFQVLAPQ